jgi:hypothetical protein
MRIVYRPFCILLSWVLAAGSLTQAQNLNVTAGSPETEDLQIRVIEGEHARVEAGKASAQPLTVAVTDSHGTPVSNAAVLFRLPTQGPTGVFNDGSRVSVVYTDLQGQAKINDIQWGATEGTAVVRVTAAKGTSHAGVLVEETIGSAITEAKTAQPAIAQPAQPKTQEAQSSIAASTAALAIPPSSPIPPPSVEIASNTSHQVTGASGSSHSGKKWIWIGIGGAVAAGATVALVSSNKKSPSAASQPTATALSIGSPSISIGHP